jgi:HEAT repeat protein
MERAEALLTRLETGAPNPRNAAEELDRLQGKMAEEGRHEEFSDRVEMLAHEWSTRRVRGETLQAWLVVVGAFGIEELVPDVEALAADPGQASPLRVHACRVLTGFPETEAASTLLEILESRSDPQVRTAAAEALAEIGTAALLPRLRALLDEDLPRAVWTAVSAAVDRVSMQR